MNRLHAYRTVVVFFGVLMLPPGSMGCAKKKKAAAATQTSTATPEATGNPLNPQPGGAPAQGVVRRGAQRQVNQQLLRNLGQYYVLYRTENGRGPRNLQEFLTYLKSDPNARTANVPQTLESGWVVMVFSPEPSSTQVLAYEKEAFQQFQNRLVLFGDGNSVKLMTEPEFQTALKGQ